MNQLRIRKRLRPPSQCQLHFTEMIRSFIQGFSEEMGENGKKRMTGHGYIPCEPQRAKIMEAKAKVPLKQDRLIWVKVFILILMLVPDGLP